MVMEKTAPVLRKMDNNGSTELQNTMIACKSPGY